MARALSVLKIAIVLLLLGGGALLLYAWARDNPQDLPWTPLELGQPVGMFTGQKLARLTTEPGRCRTLLDEAGIAYESLPDRDGGPNCGYRDGVRPQAVNDPQAIAYAPGNLTISCPVNAALALWEWHVVQPAAIDLFGQRVTQIEQLGGYGCRRLYGATTGRWSEHATADAIDIAAFVLEDGTRIAVLNGWNDKEESGLFLTRIRDGACDLFATVLSPDYNQAHADHFHFDQAERGRPGGRVCR